MSFFALQTGRWLLQEAESIPFRDLTDIATSAHLLLLADQ